MSDNTCKMKFYVDGEAEVCGERTLPGHTYCIKHRVSELGRLQRDLAVKELHFQRAKAAFDNLFAEGNSK